MIVLKHDQVCPFLSRCKYHNNYNSFCHGTSTRENDFICMYVNEKGEFIEEGKMRNHLDITGKMEFIQD